jgi:hypothetical protein
MRIFSVFYPSGPAASVAEKARFIRQGFSWSAFLATPVWALSQKCWLACALWLGWALFVASAAHFGNLDGGDALALYALGALAFGLEADRLLALRLEREGYLLRGLAIGDTEAEAESLYFSRRADLPPPASLAAVAGAPPRAASASAGGADLLGLFSSRASKR